MMRARALRLPPAGTETFFLWGPRQTGKSTLLRSAYPEARWIDLLRAEEFRRYTQNPEFLRQEIEALRDTPFTVIDEVQKVPALLDEVHWLHENRGLHFALCGSSARKVRRGQANLLGGRALRYELFGLTSNEMAGDFDLTRMLNHGYLPRILLSDQPDRLLRSYVGDYLKEEISAEGLVRKLPVYSEFLNIASLSDASLTNFSTIARECGVSSQTIRGYFDILVDTLIGTWLPAFRWRPKRRAVASPKFYFADVGVVNHLARRGRLEPGSELYGKAFENFIHHELRAYDSYSGKQAGLSHWRLAGGTEVDFVVGRMQVAVEAKATKLATSDHLKGLRQLAMDHPEVGRRILVSLEVRPRKTPDGIEVLPAADFCRRLWAGDVF
jgi:predicted AAA+ superfamily ATPase